LEYQHVAAIWRGAPLVLLHRLRVFFRLRQRGSVIAWCSGHSSGDAGVLPPDFFLTFRSSGRFSHDFCSRKIGWSSWRHPLKWKQQNAARHKKGACHQVLSGAYSRFPKPGP
jgi:hypothetical protein